MIFLHLSLKFSIFEEKCFLSHRYPDQMRDCDQFYHENQKQQCLSPHWTNHVWIVFTYIYAHDLASAQNGSSGSEPFYSPTTVTTVLFQGFMGLPLRNPTIYGMDGYYFQTVLRQKRETTHERRRLQDVDTIIDYSSFSIAN